MRRQVHLGQLGSVNMRVDLRGRDIRMPQDLLEHAQVRAASEHVGRKRVPQRMRMQPLDAHRAAVSLARGMKALAREPPAILI